MLNALQAKDLTLSYGEDPVVKDLELDIPMRRITALVGSNGSGKTTLLRALARLMKPRGGAVYLEGASIFRMSTKEVAKRLGILPQGPTAPEGLVVRDLVAQGRYPHQGWLQQWSEGDEAMLTRALEMTGMSDFADRPIDSLSGGQRQKAWIAMALAQETEILLLDEPTTYLDMAHQVEILDLLADLQKEEGRTIVMVLHDLNQACRYAHHVVAIRQGGIYVQGAPSDVVTEDVILNVFGLGCRVVEDPVAGTPLCVPICKVRKSAEVEALISRASPSGATSTGLP